MAFGKKNIYQRRINAALERAADYEPDSDKAIHIAEYVKTLEEAKATHKSSKDTIVKGCFALGSVMLMLGFERNGIITTKVLPHLPKIHF